MTGTVTAAPSFYLGTSQRSCGVLDAEAASRPGCKDHFPWHLSAGEKDPTALEEQVFCHGLPVSRAQEGSALSGGPEQALPVGSRCASSPVTQPSPVGPGTLSPNQI